MWRAQPSPFPRSELSLAPLVRLTRENPILISRTHPALPTKKNQRGSRRPQYISRTHPLSSHERTHAHTHTPSAAGHRCISGRRGRRRRGCRPRRRGCRQARRADATSVQAVRARRRSNPSWPAVLAASSSRYYLSSLPSPWTCCSLPFLSPRGISGFLMYQSRSGATKSKSGEVLSDLCLRSSLNHY